MFSDHNIFFLTLVFTVVYTSAAVLAIGLAWGQVRASMAISNKEKALEAYINFTEKYAELGRLSHDMDVRYHQRDKTLSEYDIKYFYNSFWVLQLEEWEFYQARIIPIRIFTQWMMHTHEYLLSEKTKTYFNEAGETVVISAKEAFEKHGIRVLRFHPEFIVFIRALEEIPYVKGGDIARTFDAIEKLSATFKQNTSYWKI